ncbi:unnamed protein product [Owenia fusiformis]|uniref:Uncharacterized protein n=1 Tax=Owenia fusiformis TaxID=6347 RepID=A0A8J1U6F9_OWEFU|nr:unnamed protein product [Owenia fusiformis]
MTKGRQPVITRDTLALKFRQNWIAKHPEATMEKTEKEGQLDDSLTSLNWLQNLNIMKITNPTPPPSPEPQNFSKDTKVNPNSVLNVSGVPMVRQDYKTFMGDLAPLTASPLEKIDYKTNPYVKPPYSYATLICMAMKETRKTKITLASIYNWITENFMYYRMADPSWQNSIRHNLSLNKCFQKVPRRKDEPGKGGFWRINPEYNDMLENGVFKKRRASSAREMTSCPIPLKRIKQEIEDHSYDGSHNSQDAKQAYTRSKSYHFGAEEDSLNGALKGDFSWSSILHQDIMVNGVKIKTENIIDDSELADSASNVMAMSPPSSVHSDLGIDDLLSSDLQNDLFDGQIDSSSEDSNQALDLTVSGQSIRAPEWWNESMTRDLLNCENNRSGLHTPIAPSPTPTAVENHPWAVDNRLDLDQAIAAFDIDNLFDLGNIPSPDVQ